MEEAVSVDVNARIAQRVRDLRAERGLSLEGLSAASGVSRSMLSLVERAESSPTAVVLEKIAAGLQVPLASLFDTVASGGGPVARAHEQPPWRDPHSGYERRNVSPAGAGSPIRIVEVTFPPKARVAYESGARDPAWHQQVWVLDGSIEVTVGAATHRLHAGDCLAHVLDGPVSYHNPTRRTTRYAVVIAPGPRSRRSP